MPASGARRRRRARAPALQVGTAAPQVIGQVGDEAHVRRHRRRNARPGRCPGRARTRSAARRAEAPAQEAFAPRACARCAARCASPRLAVWVAARRVANASARPAASRVGREQHFDQREAAAAVHGDVLMAATHHRRIRRAPGAATGSAGAGAASPSPHCTSSDTCSSRGAPRSGGRHGFGGGAGRDHGATSSASDSGRPRTRRRGVPAASASPTPSCVEQRLRVQRRAPASSAQRTCCAAPDSMPSSSVSAEREHREGDDHLEQGEAALRGHAFIGPPRRASASLRRSASATSTFHAACFALQLHAAAGGGAVGEEAHRAHASRRLHFARAGEDDAELLRDLAVALLRRLPGVRCGSMVNRCGSPVAIACARV